VSRLEKSLDLHRRRFLISVTMESAIPFPHRRIGASILSRIMSHGINTDTTPVKGESNFSRCQIANVCLSIDKAIHPTPFRSFAQCLAHAIRNAISYNHNSLNRDLVRFCPVDTRPFGLRPLRSVELSHEKSRSSIIPVACPTFRPEAETQSHTPESSSITAHASA
jgi:hypothetical protein